jgi:DNA-binding response OmpR family regulator
MVPALLGLNVLVVEDDPIIALDLEQILTDAGATVVGPADRIAQAQLLFERTKIDVAVLDFRLEKETASPIALQLSAKGIPFVFYTSSRGHPELQHPGVPIVEKPAHPEKLLAVVKALTNGGQSDE